MDHGHSNLMAERCLIAMAPVIGIDRIVQWYRSLKYEHRLRISSSPLDLILAAKSSQEKEELNGRE
jgi:hypothetical protein